MVTSPSDELVLDEELDRLLVDDDSVETESEPDPLEVEAVDSLDVDDELDVDCVEWLVLELVTLDELRLDSELVDSLEELVSLNEVVDRLLVPDSD